MSEFPNYCELTFDAEGGGFKVVLRVHWPGGVSGVTIGPGYDMGHRDAATARADLVAAGVPDADAQKIAEGAGKVGAVAGDWVTNHKALLPSISVDASKKLFEHVYPTYVDRAKGIVKAWGGAWDKYPQRMKEVLVDLCYRGDLASKHKAKLSPSVQSGDYTAFRKAIRDYDYWRSNTNLPDDKHGNPNGRITSRGDWLVDDGGDTEPEPEAAPGPATGGPVAFALNAMATDQLYDHLQQVWKRAQDEFGRTDDAYKFQEDDGHINLIGVRGLLSDVARGDATYLTPIPESRNQWHDTLFVVFKDDDGHKRVEIFPFCTFPNTSTEKGKAVTDWVTLTLGLHRYRIGQHHWDEPNQAEMLADCPSYPGRGWGYRALKPILDGNEKNVFWVKAGDGAALDEGEGAKESGDWGINIHFGGNAAVPTGWSLGCQVIKDWGSYRRFIALVEGDASIKRLSAADEVAATKNKPVTWSGTRPVIYLLVDSAHVRPPGIGLPIAGVAEAQALYDLNEQGDGGYFPIAANNFWHGGVHLDTDKPVIAIADGEVVAYRINKQPIEVELSGAEHPLSTGFVLIHHQRWTPKGQEIDFFSLYMHLLPLGAYSGEQLAHPPSPFKKRTFTVRIKEDGRGLNVRDGANRETILGVVPCGTYFDVPSLDDVASWGKSFVKVKYSGPDGDIEGYAAIGGRSRKLAGKPGTYVCDTKEDTPADESKLGLNVRENRSGSRVLRVAAFGAELKIKNPNEVAPGGRVALDRWVELEDGGWVYTSADKAVDGDRASLAAAATVEPEAYDEVVKAKLPIQAGAVVGYPGPYLIRDKTVHFEILTGDVAFMKNPKGDKSEAATLEIPAGTAFKKRKTKDATLQVDLPVGAVLRLVKKGRNGARQVIVDELVGWAPRSALGTWNESSASYTLGAPLATLSTEVPVEGAEPPTIAIDAKKGDRLKYHEPSGAYRRVGYTPPSGQRKQGWAMLAELGTSDDDRLYTLTAPLAKLHEEEPGTDYDFSEDAGKNDATIDADLVPDGDPSVCRDKQGKLWQEIEFAPDQKGWIQRDAPGVEAKSIYDWPRWRQVEEHGDYSDDGLCDAADVVSLIDADGDGDVTSTELKKALANPRIAGKLRRIACQHPTEWAGEIKGIERLGGPPWNVDEDDLDATKDYVKKLGFWGDLADAGLPPKDKVWNLHPIGFLEQLGKLSSTANKPPPCEARELHVSKKDKEKARPQSKSHVMQIVAEAPFEVSRSFSTKDGPSAKVKAGSGSVELKKGKGPSNLDVIDDVKKLGLKKTLEKYRDEEEEKKKKKEEEAHPGKFELSASTEFAWSPARGEAELHAEIVTARPCDATHQLHLVALADGKACEVDAAKGTLKVSYDGNDGLPSRIKPQRYRLDGAGCEGSPESVIIEVFPASTALASIDFEAESEFFDKTVKQVNKVLKGIFDAESSLKLSGGVSGFRGWREADDWRVYHAREFTAKGRGEVSFEIKISFLKFFPLVPESLVRYVADIGLSFKVTGSIGVEGKLELREFPALPPAIKTTKSANGSIELEGKIEFEVGVYAELHLLVISAQATGNINVPLKAGGELEWEEEKLEVSPFCTLEEGEFKLTVTVESWITKSEYDWHFKLWEEQQWLKGYTWTIYDHEEDAAS